MSAPRSGPRSVREPIQVYLTAADRALLDKAAHAANLPRAEILRRGLRRVAAELLSAESPALAFVEELARASWPKSMPDDIARRHDDYLAESHKERQPRRRRKTR